MNEMSREKINISRTPPGKSYDKKSLYDTTSDKRHLITRSAFRNENEDGFLTKIHKIENHYKSKLTILQERINELLNENKILYDDNQRLLSEVQSTSTKMNSKSKPNFQEFESILEDSNSSDKYKFYSKNKKDERIHKLEQELIQSREREKKLKSEVNDMKLKFKSLLNLHSLILNIDLERNQKLTRHASPTTMRTRHNSTAKLNRSSPAIDPSIEIEKVKSEIKALKRENTTFKEVFERMNRSENKDNYKSNQETPIISQKFEKANQIRQNYKEKNSEENGLIQRQETFAPNETGKHNLDIFYQNMNNFRNLIQKKEDPPLLNEQEIEGLQRELGFN